LRNRLTGLEFRGRSSNEDLHWIDSETQGLLDSLVESVPTARLLLLVNYRPEYEHRWEGKTYYTQLRLDPLPPESAEELLRALMGEDPGLTSLARRLQEREHFATATTMYREMGIT
jgi:predicted ATPase